MKSKLRILLFAFVAMAAVGFTSCGDDDDFTASIFDTTDYPLDKTAFTFPLDTFIKKNFLEPYNLKFLYKMEDIGSDMNKNLVPAGYSQSVDLAVLSKYLWYEVYEKYAGDEFLKRYSPRIIHVIGSKNYNVSSGTETLGDASGGVKINLYNVNNLNVTDIENMNEYFFKTMHHEFTHILDQTYLHPTSFNTISSSNYDASGWSEQPDSVVAGLGFVSNYASSAATEDWAEILANYVTRDSISWAQLLETARYDWEFFDIDSRNDYTKLLSPGCDLDTIGYLKEMNNGQFKIYRRLCLRNDDGTVALDADGKAQWLDLNGIDGRAIILQKVEIMRTYLKENYNINIEDLRREVQQRTYLTRADGTFVKDQFGNLVNRLTSPLESDPSVTLIESLRQGVERYKELQK